MSSTQRSDHPEMKNGSRRAIARRLRAEQRRSMREMYRKRKTTLIKKAHELGKLCEVDIAVIICRNGRYFTYRSMDRQSWPPSMDQIVSEMLVLQLSPKLIRSRRSHIHCLRTCCRKTWRRNGLRLPQRD